MQTNGCTPCTRAGGGSDTQPSASRTSGSIQSTRPGATSRPSIIAASSLVGTRGAGRAGGRRGRGQTREPLRHRNPNIRECVDEACAEHASGSVEVERVPVHVLGEVPPKDVEIED